MTQYPELRQLWSRISQEGTRGLQLSTINTTLTVLSSSALMANSAYIISFAALQPSIADIMIPVTMVRFFGIARAVLRYSERLLSHHTVFSYLSRLRVMLYTGYTQISGRAILSLSKSDALQTLTADIEVLQDFFLRAILPLLSSSIIGVLVTVILLFNIPHFAPVFILLYLLATFGMALIAQRLTKGSSEKHAELMGNYRQDFSEYSEGISELRLNNRLEDYASRVNQIASDLEDQQTQVANSKILAANGQQFLIYMTVLTALIFGIWAVEKGMNGVYLAVITLVMFSFYEAAPAFLTLFQKLESSEYSAARINQVFQLEKRQSSHNVPNELPRTLTFRSLSYQYPNSTKLITLESLTLSSAEKIAIVGPSGAGKSTIAAMLIGLLEPDEGQMILDSAQSEPLNSELLKRLFSVVHQSVYLFHKSLKDNLKLAKVDASEEELAHALTKAGLKDWLEMNWYQSDPWIGENGMLLSGGQRQRVALARALLRQTPFLVLDETFAGLDKATEASVLKSLLQDPSLGLVWITHRLVQMEDLDCIYVLDQGQVIASGKHHALLDTCPLYKAMYDTQNNMINS